MFFVEKILRLRRSGESLAPKPSGGGPEPKLTEPMRLFVREQIKRENDLNLSELAERVRENFGVRVSPPVMRRAVTAMDWRRKKDAPRFGATNEAAMLGFIQEVLAEAVEPGEIVG